MPTTAALATDLRLASMRLARRLRYQRAEHGLGFGQLSVLTSLERHGPSTAGDLAAHEQVRPPSMTRTINCLLAAGYVTRTQDDDDRRQFVVELTDSARTVLLEDRRRRDKWLAERLAELDPEQRDLLTRAIPVLEVLASQ